MNESIDFWRKCSSCKKPIGFNANYYECNVSTCTGLRTGYVFCGVSCWEVHLPGAKHRSAGAVEKKSPAKEPKRIMVTTIAASTNTAATAKSTMSNEVLVVVSKVKQYIKDISDMSTSEEVNRIISDRIRGECEKAIESARSDGRKTVMARDFK